MPSPYTMTVDLNVLDHLGINLYSNIAAVLTEAVANAWDADATNVQIAVDESDMVITITDDGIGMTVDDMNEKYLRVGYRRRDEDPEHGKVTAKGRPVMGRKGLGKLSLFSIAETIEVQSAKDGEQHGLKMTHEGIKQSVENKEQSYEPEALADDDVTIESGTLIMLRDIKRQRLGTGVAALRKRLARRFSIIGEAHGFAITINGDPVSPDDRGDLPTAQFLWYFDDHEPDASSAQDLKDKEGLSGQLDGWDPSWHVEGWIGTAHLPKQLDSDEAGNLNGIVVFARGRLVHENILDKLNDGRLFTKYLTGQVEADFLDTDDAPDIATSDRQRLQEDDPRYLQLIAFLKARLNQVEKRWVEWRKKHEVTKAKETIPALATWLDSLSPGFCDSAETLIGKLSSLPIDNDDDRKLLYKHGILAFERMRLRGSTEKFAENVENVEMLLTMLGDRDALEATMYRDIVKSRLEVIDSFQSLVDDNAKEKVLQQYLFDHLWLLDPSWERATGSELIETRLAAEGVIIDDLTEREKLGRLDITYRTTAGKHIIVELKRAGRKMTLSELFEQGKLYVDKLRKVLAAENRTSADIEVVFVIGQPIEEETTNPNQVKDLMSAISPGSRIIHYDTLIRGAQESYSEYLEQSKEMDKLEQIVDQI